MSWKSRRRKAFFRHVEQMKELPIYLIDHYIVIDESCSYYKKNKKHADYKADKRGQYKRYSLNGKIKSASDFDNYFNPDLTLDVPFEKDKRKATILVKNALIHIGQRWRERLKKQFPVQDYTIVFYYNAGDSEWYLDFYNGTVDLKELDCSKQCRDIVYLNK